MHIYSCFQHVFALKLDGKLMKKLELSDRHEYEIVKVWAAEGRHGYPPADAELKSMEFDNVGKDVFLIDGIE